MKLSYGLSASAAALSAAALLAVSATAQGQATTQKIQFRKGSTVATESGTVKGNASARYEIAGKPGLPVSIELRSKNRFIYFNVLDKNTGFALETQPSPREVTSWKGKLPAWGSYIVEVYLVRAAARRNQSARFDLKISLKP